MMRCSSLGEVQERYVRLLSPYARKHGMSFEAFGRTILTGGLPYSLVVANATQNGMEPAPFSPHDGSTDALPFSLLSGTIKATYNAHRYPDIRATEVDEIIVAPGMMPANTGVSSASLGEMHAG